MIRLTLLINDGEEQIFYVRVSHLYQENGKKGAERCHCKCSWMPEKDNRIKKQKTFLFY
jgi:hypothetical protein